MTPSENMDMMARTMTTAFAATPIVCHISTSENCIDFLLESLLQVEHEVRHVTERPRAAVEHERFVAPGAHGRLHLLVQHGQAADDADAGDAAGRRHANLGHDGAV